MTTLTVLRISVAEYAWDWCQAVLCVWAAVSSLILARRDAWFANVNADLGERTADFVRGAGGRII